MAATPSGKAEIVPLQGRASCGPWLKLQLGGQCAGSLGSLWREPSRAADTQQPLNE
jgi:hypothetical protein